MDFKNFKVGQFVTYYTKELKECQFFKITSLEEGRVKGLKLFPELQRGIDITFLPLEILEDPTQAFILGFIAMHQDFLKREERLQELLKEEAPEQYSSYMNQVGYERTKWHIEAIKQMSETINLAKQ